MMWSRNILLFVLTSVQVGLKRQQKVTAFCHYLYCYVSKTYAKFLLRSGRQICGVGAVRYILDTDVFLSP